MPKRIIIAGGGTGGHLFPGIAIAEAFMERDPGNQVLFVGTGRPVEMTVLPKRGFRHESVTAGGIKGAGLGRKFISILKIPKGIAESVGIIRRFRPDLVIGLGGYSAGPVVMAAWLLGIRTALQEQNILPGITNRVLSRFADRIYVSFQESVSKFQNPEKVIVTGNPVRKEILASSDPSPIASDPSPPFTILIIGGSQGAHRVSTAVVEAIDYLMGKGTGLNQGNVFFIHQTRPEDETAVKAAYARHGIACEVSPFFDDMARVYYHADLIIARAGATTVAEIGAVGKPAIFIPYPYAADNHQVLNAETLVREGAAEMILQKDLSGLLLAERIEYYVSNSDALEKMASRARQISRPDAAQTIVNDIVGQFCKLSANRGFPA